MNLNQFSKKYYVYVLLSEKDGSYYVGYTENVSRRLKEHNKGKHRYTKGHIPYVLVYKESYDSKKEAKDREAKIKRYGNMARFLKTRVPQSKALD